VGTYGVASAGCWWARFAAAGLVRLAHYVAGPGWTRELLLYVGDFLMLPFDREGIALAGALIFLWVAFGIPLRWGNCRGGPQSEWIGFWADMWASSRGISQRKAMWLVNWMRARIAAGHVEMADFSAVLGAARALHGPSGVLEAVCRPPVHLIRRGRAQRPGPATMVDNILTFLAEELEGEAREAMVRAFRADAEAEGQNVQLSG